MNDCVQGGIADTLTGKHKGHGQQDGPNQVFLFHIAVVSFFKDITTNDPRMLVNNYLLQCSGHSRTFVLSFDIRPDCAAKLRTEDVKCQMEYI